MVDAIRLLLLFLLCGDLLTPALLRAGAAIAGVRAGGGRRRRRHALHGGVHYPPPIQVADFDQHL